MSLYHSLQRAGLPRNLSNYLYIVPFDKSSLSDDIDEVRTMEDPWFVRHQVYRDFLRDWYENSTLSRPHMEFLIEVINLIKYNRAKYEMYDRVGRNRHYSYRHALFHEDDDENFIGELNSIARKLSHADDPAPFINYRGDLFFLQQENLWLERRYSDAEFRMMADNIRRHLVDEPRYLVESKQITESEAALLKEYLQAYPFWNFTELYAITSLNFPKGFK